MSGTSLDGVDIAYCEFTKNTTWTYDIIHSQTFEYNDQWKEILSLAEESSALDLARSDVFLGQLFGNLTNAFIDFHQINKDDLDAISSHGHTIFHQPELSLTTQIGNGAQIAALTGIKTICDFRTTDVALGGQGAPLVPIGDSLLFSEFDYCLNLGGIANISFQEKGQRISFDIGLANIVGNFLCRHLEAGYDKGGELAKSGKIDNSLLTKMNELEYFYLNSPKSLGKEFFNTQFQPLLDQSKSNLADKLHTFGVHLGMQIGKHINHGNCLVTGGGAYNEFWMEQINLQSKGKITLPTPQIIDFKEALLFAFLGALRLEEEINALKSVTGASKNSCGGCIYLG